MRSKKSALVWCLALTVIGGGVGMLFARPGILEPPSDLVVHIGQYVKSWLAESSMSGRSQFLSIILFVSVSNAIPRVIVSGVVLGIIATRIPFPRVLFYSVLAWPLIFVLFPLGYALHSEEWAQQLISAPPVRTKLESSIESLFFYVAGSTLFTLSYSASFWITSKVRAHNNSLKSDAAKPRTLG